MTHQLSSVATGCFFPTLARPALGEGEMRGLFTDPQLPQAPVLECIVRLHISSFTGRILKYKHQVFRMEIRGFPGMLGELAWETVVAKTWTFGGHTNEASYPSSMTFRFCEFQRFI